MRVPEHLSHKPIIAVDNYHKIDEIQKKAEDKDGKDESDAKGLSIGKAQWDDDEEEISAKVWRYKENTGWSRQSEELPLHRVLDLAILILSVYNSPEKKIDTFLGETVIDDEGLDKIKAFMKENEEVFEKRISELKKLLKE